MPDPSLANSLRFLREEELRQGIDLMFSAGRDFAGCADDDLQELGLDRLHHMIMHVIARRPDIPVTLLCTLTGVTKQSLGRALQPLLAKELVAERVGARDRRQRLFSLTEKGAAVEARISDRFRSRIARAYREAGAQAVDGFRRVLIGLIDQPEDRERLESANRAPEPRRFAR